MEIASWGSITSYLEALNGIIQKTHAIIFLIFEDYAKLPSLNMIKLIPSESTPLNKLAVADTVWATMPVDGLNMILA